MKIPEEYHRDCYVIRNIKIYRVLFRLFGCFFLQGLSERSYYRAKTIWRNPYTLYSIAYVLSMGFFEGRRTVNAVLLAHFSLRLSQVVAAILQVATLANAAVNFACMVVGTNLFLDFFRKCAEYENCTAFRAPTFCKVWRRDLNIRLLRIASLTKAALKFCAVMYLFYGPKGIHRHWNVFLKFSSAFSFAGFIHCDLLMYLTVGSTCEVLVWYVRAQRQAFEECLKEVAEGQADFTASPHIKAPAAFKVELIRINMCRIRELKNSINTIWSPALAVTAVTLLLGKCTALYEVLTLNGYNIEAVMTSLHVAQGVLRFNELVLISQKLQDEAQKLKDAAQAATTTLADESYCKQVQFLHDSIDPEDMCISGAGFFRLGRPLIVSMMGALITYTVILVQTGELLQDHQHHHNHTDQQATEALIDRAISTPA